MIKQHFYIIGHNPNTLADAKEFLANGANALEPDIHYHSNKAHKFFVYHSSTTYKVPLSTYLAGLRKVIKSKAKHLALLYFDIKNELPINELRDYIFEHFSKFSDCKQVSIILSYSSIDGGGFLRKYKALDAMPNAGILIDEEDEPRDVRAFFSKKSQTKIAYGNGIYVAGLKSIFRSISEGKYVQVVSKPHFKMVFTWTLASKNSMRDFLNLHINGIIVNISTVKTLKKILTTESHFSSQYVLAKPGHNPWTAPGRPAYALTIKTRDEGGAGTDSKITFTLFGSNGWVKSTVNSDYLVMMESGQTNHCTLEGKDVGRIKKLHISIDGAGNGPGWLPKSIKVASNLGTKAVTFHYGEDDWIYDDTPSTKTV